MARKDKEEDEEVWPIVQTSVDVKDWLMSWFATLYMYVGGVLVILGLYVMQWFMNSITDVSTKKRKWRHFHRLNFLFHKVTGVFMVNLNPFWSRKVEYEIPIEELPKSAIYIGNHLSFADAFFYPNALAQEFVVVAKAVSNGDDGPLIIGEVQRYSGVLRVYFEEREPGVWKPEPVRTEKMMKKAKEKLERGVSIMVFSEGTISMTGELLPFHPGMFRLGLRTNTPSIPMGSWGTQVALPMGPRDHRGWTQPQPWGFPARVLMKCGVPIDPWDFDMSQFEELINATVADTENDLCLEDFEEQNLSTLGEKLQTFYEINGSATELFEAFAEDFSTRTRRRMLELVEEVKAEYEADEAAVLKGRKDWDRWLTKTLSSSFDSSNIEMPHMKLPKLRFPSWSSKRRHRRRSRQKNDVE